MDFVSEPLPLRALLLWIKVGVCVIGPGNEAEVGGGLFSEPLWLAWKWGTDIARESAGWASHVVELLRIRIGIILEEIPRDSGELEMRFYRSSSRRE